MSLVPSSLDVIATPIYLQGKAISANKLNLAETPSVSVVIAALNEEQNLPHVLPKIPKWVDEIIIIDGGSVDQTVQVAKQLCPEVVIIHQTGKGKGDALRLGFEAATKDIIVALDADGSTAPEEIPAFVGALVSGADYVKGSRFLQGGGTSDMTILRKVGNLGLVQLVTLFYGGKFSDLCYGYNAFWRKSLPLLDLDAEGFEIETLMNIRALKANLRVAEVASFEADRIYGESNLRTFRDGWRVLKTIVSEKVHA